MNLAGGVDTRQHLRYVLHMTSQMNPNAAKTFVAAVEAAVYDTADIVTKNTLNAVLDALVKNRQKAQNELNLLRASLATLASPTANQQGAERQQQGYVDGLAVAIDEVREALGALTH